MEKIKLFKARTKLKCPLFQIDNGLFTFNGQRVIGS